MRARRKPLSIWIADNSMPEPNSGCWLWVGWCDRDGYGKANPSKLTRHRFAHRISWEEFRGPIPGGMSVLHKCDTPSCVNPDHLFLGTQLANMRDMIAKRRRASFKGERHGQSKLTADAVVAIRKLSSEGATSQMIAIHFGINDRYARDVISGIAWRHI